MSFIFILIQAILPLLLLSWLAIKPASSVLAYIVQSLSTAIVLFSIGLGTIWLFLPWWTPFIYAALWLVILIIRFFKQGFRFADTALPRGKHWIGIVLFAALGVFASVQCLEAWHARQLPDIEVVDIAFPFADGTYLVAHGGSREMVNAHMKTLDSSTERFKAYRGQSYALDLIKISSLGFRAKGWLPEDPSMYVSFGTAVYAPCSGIVLSSRNDRPDMLVPRMDLEYFYGNHVLLQCGDFALLLAHFRYGSVTHQANDRVSVGELLGQVGNSGRTSEPHLHINAQHLGQADTPLIGEPMALTIKGHYPVRNQRLKK